MAKHLFIFIGCILFASTNLVASDYTVYSGRYSCIDERGAYYSLSLTVGPRGDSKMHLVITYRANNRGYRPSDAHIQHGGWLLNGKIYFTGYNYGEDITIEKCPKPNFSNKNFKDVIEIISDSEVIYIDEWGDRIKLKRTNKL